LIKGEDNKSNIDSDDWDVEVDDDDVDIAFKGHLSDNSDDNDDDQLATPKNSQAQYVTRQKSEPKIKSVNTSDFADVIDDDIDDEVEKSLVPISQELNINIKANKDETKFIQSQYKIENKLGEFLSLIFYLLNISNFVLDAQNIYEASTEAQIVLIFARLLFDNKKFNDCLTVLKQFGQKDLKRKFCHTHQ